MKAIKKGSIVLYKYIGNKDPVKTVDYLKRFVKDGTIKATIPIEFNDPAEFKVKFEFDATEQEKANRFCQLWPNHIEECDDWVRNRTAHAESYDSLLLRAGLLRKAGVICLTLNPSDFLMWSHYAHSHTGFCIGFHATLLNDLVSRDCVGYDYVIYTKEPATVNFYKASEEEIGRAIFSHKSPVWEYEKEYRLIFENSGVRKFDTSSIKEVVIGCRASKELRDYARGLVGTGIRIFEMRESQHDYEQVKIELLEDGREVPVVITSAL
jgi:hypothetical protein